MLIEMRDSDSDDYSTDETSKKSKASEKIGGMTERSKKISRTPTRNQYNGEDKLDQILKMLIDMKNEQREIKTEQREIQNDIRQFRKEQGKISEELRKLKEENNNLKKENDKIREENTKIKVEIGKIKSNTERIEKEQKKNNIVISGLEINSKDPEVSKEVVKKFIGQHLKINVKIKAVSKITQRIYKIELEDESEKLKVMQNKAKLKKITERIFINHDLTRMERVKQYTIRKMAKEEERKGKQVKLGYNKIIVDGTEWKWNQRKEMMEKC